ncbi:hypothetical protein BJ165DRAFT_744756 [Panaeolus papilionaceus]|nr:hypothetical protein BJ165DRAFT_744756 [Panaeolus papilionaceus]
MNPHLQDPPPHRIHNTDLSTTSVSYQTFIQLLFQASNLRSCIDPRVATLSHKLTLITHTPLFSIYLLTLLSTAVGGEPTFIIGWAAALALGAHPPPSIGSRPGKWRSGLRAIALFPPPSVASRLLPTPVTSDRKTQNAKFRGLWPIIWRSASVIWVNTCRELTANFAVSVLPTHVFARLVCGTVSFRGP